MSIGLELLADRVPTQEIIDAQRDWWDLSEPLPLPKKELTCPHCGSKNVHIRQWAFFEQHFSPHNPYRVDVQCRCWDCSYLPVWALVISEAYYMARLHDGYGSMGYRADAARWVLLGGPKPERASDDHYPENGG